jgi:hypothetical protein
LNLRGELIIKAKSNNKIIHTRSTFLQGLFFMKKDNPNDIRVKLEKELDFIEDISIKSSIIYIKDASQSAKSARLCQATL